MRTKICSLFVACGLAVAALSPLAAACPGWDKEKAAKSGSQTSAVVNTVDAKNTCSKSDKAVATVALGAAGKACCPTGSGAAAAANVAAGKSDCPMQQTMTLLVRALGNMEGCCDADCAARANVVAAVRTMAKAKPELASDPVVTTLVGNSACGSARTVAAAGGDASQCSKSAAQARLVASGASCDPSTCSKKAKAVATKVRDGSPACCAASTKAARVASGASGCSSSPARYVAFGCEKTDRLARAAARAYLDRMRELKLTAGAEGCAAKAASGVLASLLEPSCGAGKN
jgi:hypothetical protein